MSLLVKVNAMNVADIFTTAYLFGTYPDAVKYELNPLIRESFLKFGHFIFMFKFIILALSTYWYHKNYSKTAPKIYNLAMKGTLAYFTLIVAINISSIIYIRVMI